MSEQFSTLTQRYVQPFVVAHVNIFGAESMRLYRGIISAFINNSGQTALLSCSSHRAGALLDACTKLGALPRDTYRRRIARPTTGRVVLKERAFSPACLPNGECSAVTGAAVLSSLETRRPVCPAPLTCSAPSARLEHCLSGPAPCVSRTSRAVLASPRRRLASDAAEAS